MGVVEYPQVPPLTKIGVFVSKETQLEAWKSACSTAESAG